ncbi:hypothetical protein [Ekhidna sp.]|uniref:hypothetical protein n=1 Tax=Ekhidna sp. TaxID=2608089 RepID=UPI0032EAED9B
MEKYKNLHLWMILPLVIIQVGIFNFYWPKLTTTSWEFHIHYWLVTGWFILMIIQPYLIEKGKTSNHRTLGMIGFLIAGGIVFTSMSLLDIPLKRAAVYDPSRPGPPLSFYYGTLVIELILGLLYGVAVIQAIRFRKKLNEHAWWMICSVFYLMMPALGRGMIVLWRALVPIEKLNPMMVALSAELIFIPLLILYAVRFGKVKHPATIIGLLTVLLRLLRVPIGSSEAIQNFLDGLIKWN